MPGRLLLAIGLRGWDVQVVPSIAIDVLTVKISETINLTKTTIASVFELYKSILDTHLDTA